MLPLSLPRHDLAGRLNILRVFGPIGAIAPGHNCNPTYNFSFTASPELGLIELVTLLLREVIRQHCFIAPIQSQPTITCNINQFYNAQKRNYYFRTTSGMVRSCLPEYLVNSAPISKHVTPFYTTINTR